MLTTQPDPSAVVWLRWRISFSTKLFLAVAILCLGLWLAGEIRWWSIRSPQAHADSFRSLAMVFGYVALPIGGIVLHDRGYRVGYDEQAIYMRPPGFTSGLRYRPSFRVAFADIVAIRGERSARSAGLGNHFTPFEFAHVYSRRGDVADTPFALIGGAIRDEDFRALLRMAEDKAPGSLDEAIERWLASSHRF